jgi:hypothetical protein
MFQTANSNTRSSKSKKIRIIQVGTLRKFEVLGFLSPQLSHAQAVVILRQGRHVTEGDKMILEDYSSQNL